MASINVDWAQVVSGKYALRCVDNGDGSVSLDTTGSGAAPTAVQIDRFVADGSGSYTLSFTPTAGTMLLFVGGGEELGFTTLAAVLTENTPSLSGTSITVYYSH
jgi:hypothetical protein